MRRSGQGRGNIPGHATLSDVSALDPTAAVDIMNHETTLAPMRLRTTHAAWTLFRRGRRTLTNICMSNPFTSMRPHAPPRPNSRLGQPGVDRYTGGCRCWSELVQQAWLALYGALTQLRAWRDRLMCLEAVQILSVCFQVAALTRWQGFSPRGLEGQRFKYDAVGMLDAVTASAPQLPLIGAVVCRGFSISV